MTSIYFRDETFTPLLSGALYWPAESTLLVADLHLEKMSSFASAGQLLPPYDSKATLAQLKKDIVSTKAQRVICLGDSFHRDKGTTSLCESDVKNLQAMTKHRDWHWLSGNHDPSAHHLGGTCAQQMAFGSITLSHEPSKNCPGQIAGHLHPSARISINGRATRRPCFVHDDQLLILPAYGVSTGTLNILSEAFSGLFRREKLNVTMLGKEKLYPVATRFLV